MNSRTLTIDDANRLALRKHALFDGEMRQAHYLSHPVVTDSLHLATEPVKEVFEVVQHLIIHRFPGSPFIGAFRMGKTHTIQILCDELRRIFPKLAIGTLIAKKHDKPTEKAFWGDALDDYEHGASLYGTAPERRRRFMSMIVSAVLSVNGDQYVFFVDEGQCWTLSEWVWMRDLTNDLKRRGIRTTTIVFAHEELNVLRDMLISTGRTDLIGRFFHTPYVFRGLRNESELQSMMQCLDDPSKHEHPCGSGICMSEFFLPAAYCAGWRLATEAPHLWAAFGQVAARQGRIAKDIGMQWVMSSIRAWLFIVANYDSADFKSPPDSWVEAIGASTYQASLQ
ncbi:MULTISPECIES: hypothetical protein [unclassified Acidovorax]|uniref:hypothetical protein n=1 Tax=unclassified Acidovorax TaxID=2684926 RepID=UPI0011B20C21|nr:MULTISPECIES: hypothetical protein [unclassified Acidovorax]MDH4416857.1 hypothetical protein [Acidovorax sp.]